MRNIILIVKTTLLWAFLCLAVGAPIVVSAPNADVDLAITKTDSVDPVIAGEALTYQITVTNTGPAIATGVAITDTLPGSATFTSASSGCVYNAGLGIVRCDPGEVGIGSVTTATIQVLVDPAATGTLLNQAIVTTLDTDTNADNNTAQATTTITSSSDLSLTKTAPASVIAGDLLTYIITVTNTGPSNASGVIATDSLPINVTLQSATASQGSCILTQCDLGGMAATGRATITMTVSVDPSATGVIANSATVSANETDPVTENNSAQETTAIVRAADLSIDKTGSPEPVFAGKNLAYRLQISNQGPSSADGVHVVDDLPAQVSFVSAPAGCTHSSGTVDCTLGRMLPGSSLVVTITVQANLAATGLITNIASVTSTATELIPSNNQSEWITNILAPDLVKPTVFWLQPVMNGQRLNVGCQTVHLQVSATDNLAIHHVRFYRWDSHALVFVEIGNDYVAPYEWDVDTCVLNASWNQVFADAQDTYGNLNWSDPLDRKYIWLYRHMVFFPVAIR